MLDTDPERRAARSSAIQADGREGLAEMRRLLGVLRDDDPPASRPQPGIAALSALVDERPRDRLSVEVTIEGSRGRSRPASTSRPTASCRRRSRTRSSTPSREGRMCTVALRRRSRARGRRRRDRPSTRRRRPRPRRDARARRALRRHARAPGGRRRRLPRQRDAAVRERGMIRVLIVDDQELVRDGFAMILDAQPDMEVVGLAADGARRSSARKRDHARRRRHGRSDAGHGRHRGHAASCATAGFERLGILDPDDLRPRRVRLRGAAAGRERLPAQGRPARDRDRGCPDRRAGDALLAPAITRRLIERYVSGPREPALPPALDELSPRERDTLARLARGCSNAEIAAELFLERDHRQDPRRLRACASSGSATASRPSSGRTNLAT